MAELRKSLRTIFDEASEIPAGEPRRAFLDQACGTDAAMRAEIEELLGSHEMAGGFLADPTREGAAVNVAPAQREGDHIGRYRLLEKIGEGGFGEVWMAEQREPVRRRVALKIIKLGMDSRQVIARFEAERQALALMDHPNIARIYDAGAIPQSQDRPYFVMELVRGIAITEYCDQNQFTTRQRLDLFIQVCQAIQHAHQKGIIHRDIKPSNILVTFNDGVPVPKVIDFGIAKATQQGLTDHTVFTQFHHFIGTPAYISPEQAEMSSLDVDTRADIYSLGVLLYELLVGQTPFDAREMMKGGLDALRRIIREREPQRPSTKLNLLPGDTKTTVGKRRQTDTAKLVHQLQGDLDWIVMKCLEKDRTRRYDTANGLAADLKRHLGNEPVTARPPSLSYRFGKAFRRNRLVFIAATAVAIALLAAVAVSSRQMLTAQKAQRETEAARQGEESQRREAQRKQTEAETERQRAERFAQEVDAANRQLKRAATRAEFTTGTHFIETGALSKGIAHLARSLRTDPGYWPAATRLISTLTERGYALDDLPAITHTQPIYGNVLNASTGLLVTRGLDYDLRVWNAWTAERLMDIPAIGNRRMPSLSADGRRMLYVDTNGLAQVFEPFTQSGTPRTTLRAGARIVDAVFSPAAGPGLKAATKQPDGSIQFWDAESGSPLGPPLTGPSTDGGFLEFTPDGQRLVASFADGKVAVWSTPPRSDPARLIPVEPKSHLRLAPDSRTLVEGGSDGKSVRFWDLASGVARGDRVAFAEPLARYPSDLEMVALGTGHAHDFSFSDNGARMLAVSHDTPLPFQDRILHPRVEFHLFDVPSGKLLRTLSETNVTYHEANLVSGLGAMVLNTNRLVIRSLSTGAIQMDRVWHNDWIQALTFSPAGDRILVAFTDRRMILFDTRTGDSLTQPGDPAQFSHVAGGSGRVPGQTYPMRHAERIVDLEFSPEGETFLVHDATGALQLWDAMDGVPFSEPIPERSGRVRFSRDGRWMVVFRPSGGIGGNRLNHGAIHGVGRDLSAARHRALPYKGWAPALHFSADGRYGLVGHDGLVVFDPSTGELIRRIDPAVVGTLEALGYISWLITEAWFSPSAEKIVAVGDVDSVRAVRVVETATGRLLHTFPDPEGTRFSRARFVGESNVVTLSFTYQDGLKPLKLWDLATGRIVAEAKPDAGGRLEVSPDGRRVASLGHGTALLNGADLKPICPVLTHRNPVSEIYSAAFSPDSRRLVTGSIDGTVRVWKAETGELEAEFEHGSWPRWVSFSPDSQRVVATHGRYDVPSGANVWEFVEGKTRLVTSTLTHPNTIYHAQFSADGKYLFAGDRGAYAQLWDLDTSLPMLDWLFADANVGVNRVGINPQTSRVFVATMTGNQLHHRPLPPRGVAVPDWLPSLAEAVAGRWINDRGALEPLGRARLQKIKALVAQLPAQTGSEDFYPNWARWFFADRSRRAVAPLSSVTVPAEVNELLAEGSLQSLRRAHHISPTDARVFAALARELGANEVFREGAPMDPGASSPSEWYAAQAVERAPGSVEPHWSQAEVLLRLGKPDAARQALDPAIRLQADHPNVLALQSELARLRGQTNEAHTLLARALNAPTPKPTSAYLRLDTIASRPDFFAEAALRNRTERRIAGRPPGLPAQLLDLTPWFTGPLESAHTNKAKPASGFHQPILQIDGVPLDLRGVVSLDTFPSAAGRLKAIQGIPVGQRAARLHLLAGSGGPGCRLRVHYADQQDREFSLAPIWNENRIVSWDNPRPEVPIQSIDLIAAPNSRSSIVAITVQTEPDPVVALQPPSAYPRVQLGQPLELHATVTPPGSWSYQWSVNQQPISGATHSTLRIAHTTAKDLARYQVEVRTTNPDPANRGGRSRPVWAVDAADPFVHGALKEELYLNVPGGSVEDLRKSPNFPGRPDAIDFVSALEAHEIPHDHFGRRLSGWLVPKESARYRFFLCSDDASSLAISTDETAGKLEVIATLGGWSRPRRWESLNPESISKPVRLEAGRRYFIEVLHKEGEYEDHLSVAWRKVDEAPPKDGDAPIGPEHLQIPAQ